MAEEQLQGNIINEAQFAELKRLMVRQSRFNGGFVLGDKIDEKYLTAHGLAALVEHGKTTLELMKAVTLLTQHFVNFRREETAQRKLDVALKAMNQLRGNEIIEAALTEIETIKPEPINGSKQA